MSFFTLEDTRLTEFKVAKNSALNNVPLKLKVIVGSIDVTPDYHIKVSDLGTSVNGFVYKHFYNKGYGGVKFKVEVMIGKNDVWKSKLYNKYKNGTITGEYSYKVTDILHEWIRNLVPLKLVTDAIDIPSTEYVITKNSSRKQEYTNYTKWELEFTKYVPLNRYEFKNDNTRVKKAIAKAKAKNVQTKSNSSKKKTTNLSLLKKCKLTNLKYSKKKKTYKCVKYLQKRLKALKFYTGGVDGWYGSMTVSAVKKFQKAYNKKKNKKKKVKLTVNGKINKNTFDAICGKI